MSVTVLLAAYTDLNIPVAMPQQVLGSEPTLWELHKAWDNPTQQQQQQQQQ